MHKELIRCGCLGLGHYGPLFMSVAITLTQSGAQWRRSERLDSLQDQKSYQGYGVFENDCGPAYHIEHAERYARHQDALTEKFPIAYVII